MVFHERQGFHKLFACGCPDRGREFDKRRDKELLKRYDCILYTINTDPPPPKVIVILMEIPIHCGNADERARLLPLGKSNVPPPHTSISAVPFVSSTTLLKAVFRNSVSDFNLCQNAPKILIFCPFYRHVVSSQQSSLSLTPSSTLSLLNNHLSNLQSLFFCTCL